MMKGKTRVYARGSTSEQEDTITGQLARGRGEHEARFQAEGYEWGREYADRGVSGAKPFLKRPEGFRLDLDLEKGDVVVMTKLDRGFRSFRDFVLVLERWEGKGVRLVVLDLGVDTGTMVGRLVGNILASVAEFERARIAERTAEAVTVRRREGRPLNGKPPYGFRIDRSTPRKRLVPDARIREIGARCLGWYENDRWSFDRIWSWLAQNSVHRVPAGPKGPGKEFSRSAIVRMVAEERRYQSLEAQGVPVTAEIASALPRLEL